MTAALRWYWQAAQDALMLELARVLALFWVGLRAWADRRRAQVSSVASASELARPGVVEQPAWPRLGARCCEFCSKTPRLQGTRPGANGPGRSTS